jgi:hypothetical protein
VRTSRGDLGPAHDAGSPVTNNRGGSGERRSPPPTRMRVRDRESRQRKSRMVEISLSGSGEGPGGVSPRGYSTASPAPRRPPARGRRVLRQNRWGTSPPGGASSHTRAASTRESSPRRRRGTIASEHRRIARPDGLRSPQAHSARTASFPAKTNKSPGQPRPSTSRGCGCGGAGWASQSLSPSTTRSGSARHHRPRKLFAVRGSP